MIPDEVTPAQRKILAEIGHLHVMLESHQMAAKYCREQLKQLRSRLEQMEHSQQPPAA